FVFLQLHPAPLLFMAIPVAQQHVHQPGLEKGDGIDGFPWILVQLVEKLVRVGDLPGAFEARGIVIPAGWALLEGSEHATEIAELAKRRIMRHDEHLHRRDSYARGFEQRWNDERAGGMGCADLILKDFVGEGLAKLGGQLWGRILVYRAEGPLAA